MIMNILVKFWYIQLLRLSTTIFAKYLNNRRVLLVSICSLYYVGHLLLKYNNKKVEILSRENKIYINSTFLVSTVSTVV